MEANNQRAIDALNRMIISCFTYEDAERGSFSFNRYIAPFIDELGEELFDEVYTSKLTDLKSNYIVKHSVYTDSEDVSYNNLVRVKFDN